MNELIMTLYLLCANVFWWVALFRAAHKDGFYFGQHPISFQLRGKWSLPVDAAFAFLAIGWCMFPAVVGAPTHWVHVCSYLAALGTVGAMASRTMFYNDKVHYTSAALAFILGAAAVVLAGNHTHNILLTACGYLVALPPLLKLTKTGFVDRAKAEWGSAIFLSLGIIIGTISGVLRFYGLI